MKTWLVDLTATTEDDWGSGDIAAEIESYVNKGDGIHVTVSKSDVVELEGEEVNEMKQEEALAKMLSKLVDDYVEAADVFGDAMAEMETTVIYHHDDMDMKIRVIVSEPNEEEESEGAE